MNTNEPKNPSTPPQNKLQNYTIFILVLTLLITSTYLLTYNTTTTIYLEGTPHIEQTQPYIGEGATLILFSITLLAWITYQNTKTNKQHL